MSWRVLSATLVALALRSLVIARLGWTYRPFQDPFVLYDFGRDFTVFIFLFGACLKILNVLFGPRES